MKNGFYWPTSVLECDCDCVSFCVQFADGVLAACLFVLEKSQTPASGWGDPVNIARLMSAMVSGYYNF